MAEFVCSKINPFPGPRRDAVVSLVWTFSPPDGGFEIADLGAYCTYLSRNMGFVLSSFLHFVKFDFLPFQ
jgi:hypothetical protein